ncbi:MAG: ABC transporter substrate-binding protein [Deltaproteobacteria bacterium]|nr:ABC transporter substrate-binding protein [Deltaproteobacteria bacterium]
MRIGGIPLIFNVLSIFFSLLIMPPFAYAGDVAAVKSVDIVPYREAVNGFKNVVNKRVHEYVIMDEKGMDNSVVLRLKEQKTDLIFALGTDALALAKGEFKNTPVVFAFVLNPDAVIGKDIDAVAQGNIKGIDMIAPPMEQFNALLEIAPKVKRIGVIYDPSKTQDIINDAAIAAKSLGLTLVTREIKSGGEAIDAVSDMEGKIDALWMAPDTTAITRESIEYMLLFSFRNRVPVIGISDKYVKEGALLALSFDSEDMGRQAGEVAMKILEGGDTTHIHLLKPRKLKLSINLNTAEKLGLNISERVISKADKKYR